MATDRLRVEGNERMDLADFQFALGDQTLANHRQLLSQLICSPARERKWVLSGFAITSPTSTQVQVAKGRGLFAEIRSGEAHYGILTTEGDATKIVDINTYPTGLYGIYVRFEEVEGSFQPRIFWNASGLGSEYTETVATRYLASWSVRVEATDPGDEWLQIGTVNRADMALVDMRDFYFEGPVDGSYASGWSTDGGGSANDRSADRKTYGVTDFQEFSAATRQCLEDIKGRGLRRWWARDIGGMNLGFDAAPVEDRLALGDANCFLDGGTNKRWQFDTDDHLTYNRTGNVLTLGIGAAIHNWDATSQSPETTDAIDLGKAGKRYANLYLGSAARISRAAAGAGERNWQLSIADVGGFETLQLGSQSEAWDSFSAALSVTRAANAGTITKVSLPNGLYYDVASYALCADTTNGSLGKTGERWKYAYIDTLVSGNMTAGTAFLPDTDGGANLGASDKYFLTSYVTEQFTSILRPPPTKDPYQIDVYGDFVAASTNAIGVTGKRWANGFFSTVTASTIKSTSLTIKSEEDGDVNVYARGAILPVASQSLNIGSATAGDRIDNGYFDTLNVYLGFSVVDDKVTSNLIPDSAARTLGRIGLRWEGFFGNLAMNIGTVYTRLVADENLGADLGTSGNYFANGYINTLRSTNSYATTFHGALDGAASSCSGLSLNATNVTAGGTVTTGQYNGSNHMFLSGLAGGHSFEFQYNWTETNINPPNNPIACWGSIYTDLAGSPLTMVPGVYFQGYPYGVLGGTPSVIDGQFMINQGVRAATGANVSNVRGAASYSNWGWVLVNINGAPYGIPAWLWGIIE